jgi:hypothetical protein
MLHLLGWVGIAVIVVVIAVNAAFMLISPAIAEYEYKYTAIVYAGVLAWQNQSNAKPKYTSAGRRSITYNSRTGPPGQRVTTPSSSDSVRYTRRRGLRSMSTPVKISSAATVAVGVAI